MFTVYPSLPPRRSFLTAPVLQRSLQCLFTLCSIYIGWRFYAFCLWAQGVSLVAVGRPAGVESFLPLSALLGLKHFIMTGEFDPAHPAGLTILLVALAAGLLLRKGFCGYICPVGLLANLVSGLGRKLGLQRNVPHRLDLVLRCLKYPLLGFFLLTIGASMNAQAVRAFLTSNYNLTADAHLLRFFLSPSATALGVLGVLGLAHLFIRNVWCRWLCPYGALLGVLAWIGSWFGAPRIRRDKEACVDCGRCDRACPAAIPVRTKQDIRTPECIGCARCVAACGKRNALRVTAWGRTIPWAALGLGTLALFLAAWVWAKVTGHWDSSIPPAMLKMLYGRALGGM